MSTTVLANDDGWLFYDACHRILACDGLPQSRVWVESLMGWVISHATLDELEAVNALGELEHYIRTAPALAPAWLVWQCETNPHLRDRLLGA